eukprot:COSAG04_NODE_1340_length_7149_cov_21.595748_8_plen_226_part_00
MRPPRDGSEQRQQSWRHSPHAVLVPVITTASAVTAAISGGCAGIVPPASNRIVHRHTTNLDLLPDAIRLCQPRHRQRVCRGVILVEVGAEICRQAAKIMSQSDRKRKTTTHSRDKQRGTVRSSGVGTEHITRRQPNRSKGRALTAREVEAAVLRDGLGGCDVGQLLSLKRDRKVLDVERGRAVRVLRRSAVSVNTKPSEKKTSASSRALRTQPSANGRVGSPGRP